MRARMYVSRAQGGLIGRWVLSRELGFGRTKSVGLGSSSGRRRCLPILERFASEGAGRVAGNKMPLNVERVMDDGVNGQEALG
jgi:hypothetical protein